MYSHHQRNAILKRVTALLSGIKPNGRLVSTLNPADPAEAEKLGITAIRMAVHSSSGDLEALVNLVESGVVKPFITKRFTLENIAEMHVAASGSRGKLLLEVDTTI